MKEAFKNQFDPCLRWKFSVICFAQWPWSKRWEKEQTLALSAFSPGLSPDALTTVISQRKATEVAVSQEREAAAGKAPVSRLSESISLEIRFVSVAGPSMRLLCMCFQYFVPSRGLRTLGT